MPKVRNLDCMSMSLHYKYRCTILRYGRALSSMRLMEDFLELAKENTEKDMETCGILGAFLVMVPGAFAIALVFAPEVPVEGAVDCFVYGMSIPKGCPEAGFHPHENPDNGSPMHEQCSNVYKNSNLRFEIFDLR